MKKSTPKTRSLTLSSNALYYAVLSFFIFGALLGLLAILESKTALDCAGSNFEKRKAQKILYLSIAGISAPALGFIADLFSNATMFDRVVYNSWLFLIISFMAKN